MELEENNLMDDLKNSKNFLSQINTLKEKLPSILDDFKKYYVFYNKNPEYNEYQQMFENIKSNLQNMNEPTAGLGRSLKNMFNTEEHDNDKLKKIKIQIDNLQELNKPTDETNTFATALNKTLANH